MHRYPATSLAALIAAAMAVTGLAGCGYNSPMGGDESASEQDAGMQLFNEETGGIDEDPMIGGGEAGFDQ